ncbi:helix-turn-helix domain-containing protein [Escherichia coli]|uniref:Transcriptional regulator n=1 Tax=Actinobacillus porcitonsillarum TaxID=189834 RepID=A0A2U8FJN2_9PAST|nr:MULTISPECIES: helix-turn-helix domain-containing protein [Pasteurellaceae]AWI51163.1 transcriptional regulator [Actinobacillus porcitonsillarum]MDG2955137.1 helix-turn-helix domain-containing protein [Exercitatus varius]WGE88113.1 helix-turn-helix transcriptional regulator [Actinobacillus equuli subsp. haemolyticus]WGE88119.1 helix-turn-helix transcriptional regulator [Actinobacillus equuli subsp. haemolyticus]
MKSNDFDNIACPIADVLGVLNDKWTGLLLRDLLLGVKRYSDLQKNSNITHATLSSRLKSLESNGLVQKQLYQTNPDRYEYHLTEQGKDMLWLVAALAQIGTKWHLSDWIDTPLQFVNTATGHFVRLALIDEQTGEEVDVSKVALVEKGK